MIKNYKILNSKQVKEVHSVLKAQFGFEGRIDGVFLENNKGRLYLVNRDFEDLPYEELNVDSIGLYIAARMPDGIRLTIEGAQIVGVQAKHNVLVLSEGQLHAWLKGEDLDLEEEAGRGADNGYYIVKHQEDFFGSTKVRDGRALNYLSKSRRLKVIND
ncbi:hypothetical protein JW868_03185 [Candidatus Woesearchaeota archaeon]|nr:hypothetical protein [Candidatus Woesearchaeota archaeon]